MTLQHMLVSELLLVEIVESVCSVADQKRTPQSLQTAYVNKSSHRSQPPTGGEHGRSFRPTPPTSHPLSDTGPCTYVHHINVFNIVVT